MQNKQKNLSAYTDYRINERGFTFITTLAMLSILALTLPILSYTLEAVRPNTTYDELSVQEFYRFMRDEMIHSHAFYIKENKLHLEQEIDETAIISLHDRGNQLRRQVNNRGHEIYLQDVAQVQFLNDPYGVRIVITDTKGETYEKLFIFYN